MLSSAAFSPLHGRTGYRPVRAEHAAVPRLRAQQRFALWALIEELAGIRRHDFLLPVPTEGTGDDGFKKSRFVHGKMRMRAPAPQTAAPRLRQRRRYAKPYYCWNVKHWNFKRAGPPSMASRSLLCCRDGYRPVFPAQHYSFVIVPSCRRQPCHAKVQRCSGAGSFFFLSWQPKST